MTFNGCPEGRYGRIGCRRKRIKQTYPAMNTLSGASRVFCVLLLALLFDNCANRSTHELALYILPCPFGSEVISDAAKTKDARESYESSSLRISRVVPLATCGANIISGVVYYYAGVRRHDKAEERSIVVALFNNKKKLFIFLL